MKKRLVSFDFIRVIAMLLILIFHWNVTMDKWEINAPYILMGAGVNGNILANIGVSLFFILSGASLMYSCRDGLRLKTFYRKRFLSIYPQYWLTYAVVFLDFYIVHREPMTETPKFLILSAAGMDGFLYYKYPCYYLIGEWFVGCIVILYILYPLLHRCVDRRPVLTAAAAAAGFVLLERFYPFVMESPRFPLMRVPEVLFGMYFVKLFYSPQKLQEKREGCPVWLAVPAFAAFLALFAVKLPVSMDYLNLWAGVSSFLSLDFLFGFLGRMPQRSWKPVSALSGFSYSVFLLHHVYMDRALEPYAGRELSLAESVWLFLKYAAVIVCAAIVLALVCRRLVSFFSAVRQKCTEQRKNKEVQRKS